MFITLFNNKPYPHNREQKYIYNINIARLQGLSDDELHYLMEQTRVTCQAQLDANDVECKRRETQHQSRANKRGMYHELEYYYNVSETDNHLIFLDWIKKHMMNQYHALFSRRGSLPGVARSKKTRYNKKINRKATRKTSCR